MTPQELLDFEAAHPGHSAAKEQAIRDELGITEVRYYVLLARAAESIDGIAHDPITARKVREQGEGRMFCEPRTANSEDRLHRRLHD